MLLVCTKGAFLLFIENCCICCLWSAIHISSGSASCLSKTKINWGRPVHVFGKVVSIYRSSARTALHNFPYYKYENRHLSTVTICVHHCCIAVYINVGNMAVFGETLYNLLWAKDKMKNKRPFAKTNHVLVINLALADFLMGVYLIILASKAAQTSGRYCREDKPWRSSATCDFLGTLAVLSCVNSVLILVILTSYRVYGVMWPYKCNDLNHMKAQWFALLAWTISFLLGEYCC